MVHENLKTINFLKKIMKEYGENKKEMFQEAINSIEKSKDSFEVVYYGGRFWSVENLDKYEVLIDVDTVECEDLN